MTTLGIPISSESQKVIHFPFERIFPALRAPPGLPYFPETFLILSDPACHVTDWDNDT